MKRKLLVFALLMASAWPALKAGTSQCVTQTPCKKGESPPSCCQAPPCEFFEQIRMKKAVQWVYRSKALRQKMLRQAGGDPVKAGDLLYQEVLKRAQRLGNKLRCSWTGKYQPPPSLETTNDCRIGGPSGPMSRETAHQTFTTCQEFVDAAYDHEDHHKAICFRTNSVERENMPINTFADEEVAAYNKEIDKLTADLKSFWRACSPKLDSASARQLANLGIKTFVKGR